MWHTILYTGGVTKESTYILPRRKTIPTTATHYSQANQCFNWKVMLYKTKTITYIRLIILEN